MPYLPHCLGYLLLPDVSFPEFTTYHLQSEDKNLLVPNMNFIFNGPLAHAWLPFLGLRVVIILSLSLQVHASPSLRTAYDSFDLVKCGTARAFDDSEPSSVSSLSSLSLLRRADYSCGPGNPCSNGACCGEGGFCGYGPTYCGAGCVSNCNAVAECGQFSSPAGKKCPLNTCCSEFGFCGTTKVSKNNLS